MLKGYLKMLHIYTFQIAFKWLQQGVFVFLLFVCFTLALSLSETLDESNISPAKNKRWYLLHSHPLIQQALGREPNQCALIQIFNTVFEDTHISYSVL